jgi:hypothetical protein
MRPHSDGCLLNEGVHMAWEPDKDSITFIH